MKKTQPLALTITAIGVMATSGIANAQQGFNFYDFLGGLLGNDRQTSHTHTSTTTQRNGNLYRNVYDLDNLSHQMVNYYGWEVRRHPSCPKVRALYTHMRSHAGTCDNLVKAFRGTCPKSFKKAACATKESATRLSSLRNQVTVNQNICSMVRETVTKASFVHNNTHLFRPVPPAPAYDPVYTQIGTHMQVIPSYSNQLVSLYSREAPCGCPCAQALLTGIRKYDNDVAALRRAYLGTCPKTFKKSACQARTSLTNVQNLRKKVQVSSRVCSLIRQSCPKLTYVHTNSNHFQPYLANRSIRGGNPTTYPVSNGSRNRGGGYYRSASW